VRTLLILGAGTGGTMLANRMATVFDPVEWQIIVVDREQTHCYQPGLLFVPFDMANPADLIKPEKQLLHHNVELVISAIERLDPEQNRVHLTEDQRIIYYDELVIATGSHIHPEETPGLLDGGAWQQNIFDFYTLTGAKNLSHFLSRWDGGRLVVNIAEMPIKCPVAPLEFLLLADWFFHERRMRDEVELVLATPLAGAFTRPVASQVLGNLLEERNIKVQADFNIAEVDTTSQKIRSYDDREIGYDLLVSIPTHMGAEFLSEAGIANELNFVPVDKHTLQSLRYENIWAIGDAADIPTSKAGSVAHFMLDTLAHNLQRHSWGLPPLPDFDGHANCFIESGFDKAFLLDFNYDTEPLPGKYPLPGLGPFTLLAETNTNHRGKLAFEWVYWNILLKDRPLPVSSKFSMFGKNKFASAISARTFN
jgi:sulfide:quinone oxidoreductase